MIQEPTDEYGPYFVVIEGTNIRSELSGRDVHTPKVYDTMELAQTTIDASVRYRIQNGLPLLAPRVPISVAEYDRKYSAYQNIHRE